MFIQYFGTVNLLPTLQSSGWR